MSDQAKEMTIVVAGALLGSVSAYLLLTPRGGDMLHRLGPTLDELKVTISDMRHVIKKIDEVAVEGKHVVRDLEDSLRRLVELSETPIASENSDTTVDATV